MDYKERVAKKRKRNLIAKMLEEDEFRQRIDSVEKTEYRRLRKQDIERFLIEEDGT